MCTKFTLMIYSIIMTQIRFALKILCSTVLLSFVNTAAGAGILERMGWSESSAGSESQSHLLSLARLLITPGNKGRRAHDSHRVSIESRRIDGAVLLNCFYAASSEWPQLPPFPTSSLHAVIDHRDWNNLVVMHRAL